MSIQKLIDQTFSYSLEAQGTDLADLYLADTADFQAVQRMINENDIDGAVAKIQRMDTEPREQIILAIADEYGNGYVETVIGYEVA
jgi:benzoyl-CoA reductase/2-hydroxyglutaryl-CoA dehydratase subunit BcrC/BadD/HgdB